MSKHPEHPEDLYRALGRIEGKLDTILLQTNDHGQRIESLEQSRSRLKGMAVAATGLGGIGTTIAAWAAWAKGLFHS